MCCIGPIKWCWTGKLPHSSIFCKQRHSLAKLSGLQSTFPQHFNIAIHLYTYLDLLNNIGKAAVLLFVNINEVNGVVEIVNVFGVHFEKRSKILHDVTYTTHRKSQNQFKAQVIKEVNGQNSDFIYLSVGCFHPTDWAAPPAEAIDGRYVICRGI